MADDDNGDDDEDEDGDDKGEQKPPRGMLGRVFDKLTHKHPPPKSAAPSFIRQERGPSGPTPGGMAPSGMAPGRPAVEPRQEPQPAADPAKQRLHEQAERRRDALRKIEQDCREGQRRDHAERGELLRERAAGTVGVQRLAVEQEQQQAAAGHVSEVAMLDEYFAHRRASLDAAIETAFDVGHFTDAEAEAENRAASRAAEHEAGRDDDDGGRGLGD